MLTGASPTDFSNTVRSLPVVQLPRPRLLSGATGQKRNLFRLIHEMPCHVGHLPGAYWS